MVGNSTLAPPGLVAALVQWQWGFPPGHGLPACSRMVGTMLTACYRVLPQLCCTQGHRQHGGYQTQKVISVSFFYQLLSFNVFQGWSSLCELLLFVWAAWVNYSWSSANRIAVEKQTGMSSGLSVSTRLSSIISSIIQCLYYQGKQTRLCLTLRS